VLQRVDAVIGTAKVIFMAIWGANGFHVLDLTQSKCRFNAQYFMEHVMVPLVQTVFPQERTQYTPRLNVHLDNCNVHFLKVTGQFSSRINCRMFPTHLIVPTWPPSDFWLFRCIKTGLAGRSFAEPKELFELLEDVREFLEGIPAAELIAVSSAVLIE
jgi:hypothetical protein